MKFWYFSKKTNPLCIFTHLGSFKNQRILFESDIMSTECHVFLYHKHSCAIPQFLRPYVICIAIPMHISQKASPAKAPPEQQGIPTSGFDLRTPCCHMCSFHYCSPCSTKLQRVHPFILLTLITAAASLK